MPPPETVQLAVVAPALMRASSTQSIAYCNALSDFRPTSVSLMDRDTIVPKAKSDDGGVMGRTEPSGCVSFRLLTSVLLASYHVNDGEAVRFEPHWGNERKEGFISKEQGQRMDKKIMGERRRAMAAAVFA